jgi:hypothetical protein
MTWHTIFARRYRAAATDCAGLGSIASYTTRFITVCGFAARQGQTNNARYMVGCRPTQVTSVEQPLMTWRAPL